MRKVALAREEAYERASLVRQVIAYRAAQNRVTLFERVEHGALRYLSLDVQLHLAVNACERTQRQWKQDAYHVSVCTSTERTAGRSRTIGDQLSPASEET